MEEGADFGDVESMLCVPGGHFQRNRNGAVVNIRRADLTPLAKYLMASFHTNIQSCSHVSDITVSRALLLYCVLRGMSINIGQVIANEIQVIDEAYYRQYYGEDEAAQLVPPRQTSRGRGPPQAPAQPHDVESFQMRDMYMSLIDARMQSIHKGHMAIVEIIIGMYDSPPGHRWTMEEFNNVVAWPEEQAQASGAGVAEAPAMDDDDDDDDEFEDDGEEEDSDDSMG
ncbi:hypothetical protein LR48_Vigan09g078900 [Vigna angularis]|uniref:Putative plant transposon protein domain-containing protein n=1 Tax=Phaseolus angularis TaxID=3914 RepID=A0A0L9VAN1_PHAAN|nr:hypothetical protein LR48_Vigan09g078900 [Vigna angularis]